MLALRRSDWPGQHLFGTRPHDNSPYTA